MIVERLKDDPDRLALLALNPDFERTEKFARMCTGCSSDPVSYKDGIIEIKVRLTERVLKEEAFKQENLIRGLIGNWVRALPQAKGFLAHICRTEMAEAGFNTPAAGLFDETGKVSNEAVGQLVDQFKTLMTAQRIDIKIDERRATWSVNPGKFVEAQRDGN